MKRGMVIAILVLFVCAGAAYAADEGMKDSSKNLGTETVSTVTDTATSAVEGTADIAKTSVSDTAKTPTTAIQAVQDTANTALNRTDAVMKTITGEGDEDIK